MIIMNMRLLTATMVLISLASAPQVLRADPPSGLAATTEQPSQSMRYYDGLRWREIWLSEQEVAEVIQGQQDAALFRSLVPNAQLLQQGKTIRIWRLDRTTSAPQLTRNLAGAGLTQFSPVFYLSISGGTRLVPSGKIMIRFNEDLNQAHLTDWANEQGLTLVKQMGLAATYLFDAGDGMAALEKANRIQESGAVQYAVPEWWREAYTR